MATILLNEGTKIEVADTAAEIKKRIIEEKKQGEPNANYIKVIAKFKKPDTTDFVKMEEIVKEIELNSKRILYFY